jgi:hypothetical protein
MKKKKNFKVVQIAKAEFEPSVNIMKGQMDERKIDLKAD